jgi:hypothetical protein
MLQNLLISQLDTNWDYETLFQQDTMAPIFPRQALPWEKGFVVVIKPHGHKCHLA